jgi:hypothetical protein
MFSTQVQLLYPFFVGSAGASYMPQMFNDRVTSPPEFSQWFSEKMIYIPHTYYVNSHMHAWAGVPPVRLTEEERPQQGLPDKGPVLTNFNQFYKVLAQHLGPLFRRTDCVFIVLLWYSRGSAARVCIALPYSHCHRGLRCFGALHACMNASLESLANMWLCTLF